MLIPKISLDVAAPVEFGSPGSELRSFFLFGDAYLSLSAEAAVSSPTDVVKGTLLGTAYGKWCRAGPFPAGPEGLAAAAEWLHAGAGSAALDVTSEMAQLPSRDAVLALAESFKAL